MNYPRREPYFAHRFVRILHKSCAAQDIGPSACYLCCVIAHTEDAARYAGPARFWNSQLAETMGFRSPQQLVRERDRAVAAGWLVYQRQGTRAVGEYFVAIPERFAGLSDAAIEPVIRSTIHSESGSNGELIRSENGTNTPPIHSKNGSNGSGDSFQKWNESVTEPGTLPNPIPFPKEDTQRTNGEDAPGFLPWTLKDGATWKLPQAKLDEWVATFEHLDVHAKLRELRQWSEDNPAKRKTCGGILRHLSTCLSFDNGRAKPKAETRPRPATREEIEASGYTFIDATGEVP